MINFINMDIPFMILYLLFPRVLAAQEVLLFHDLILYQIYQSVVPKSSFIHKYNYHFLAVVTSR